MEKKLKIFQICPRYPFPPDDGGKIGIANIFREFSDQGAQPTMFTLNHEVLSDEYISEGEKYGDIINYVHNTGNTLPRIIASAFSTKPIYIAKHNAYEIDRFIDKIMVRYEPDVIHADHSCMAPLALYASEISGKPVGLRLHNIEWTIWQRYADNLPKRHPRHIYVQRQAKLLKKAESRYYEQVDACFAITDKDRDRALEMAPNANVLVASAGVNHEEWQPDNSIERNPHEMILATTYHWIHNVDAVRWFIENVMPEVRKSEPEATLTLIGKEAPDWLYDHKDDGVNTLGYVDRVQPHLNRASIYVAPLFVGGGIRIKILEAMAMELPVLATPVSAEGIKAGRGNGLFICKDVKDYTSTILELMKNPELARTAGKAAREYVLREYSWRNNVGIMLDEYKRLTGK